MSNIQIIKTTLSQLPVDELYFEEDSNVLSVSLNVKCLFLLRIYEDGKKWRASIITIKAYKMFPCESQAFDDLKHLTDAIKIDLLEEGYM
jgi:hypothetical protein